MEGPNVSVKAKDYLVKVPLINGRSQRIDESKRLFGESPSHQWKVLT